MSEEYGLRTQRGEVLAIVPWVADRWGTMMRRRVREGLEVVCKEHGESAVRWWRDREGWCNASWIALALMALGDKEAAKPFKQLAKKYKAADLQERLALQIVGMKEDEEQLQLALTALQKKRFMVEAELACDG